MKNVQKIAAQGDVMFRRVDKLPADAVEQKPTESMVVSHSETGHNHVATHSTPNAAVLFSMPNNPLVSYIKSKEVGYLDIVHHRPWDTHETLRLLVDAPDVVWEIRRQREATPEGWKQVMD